MLPGLRSATLSSATSYALGAHFEITISYNEAVYVDDEGGTNTPSIGLTIGGVTKSATLTSGAGTQSLTFRYTVEAGLDSASGFEIENRIQLNGATMGDQDDTDADGNLDGDDAVLRFTVPDTSGVTISS